MHTLVSMFYQNMGTPHNRRKAESRSMSYHSSIFGVIEQRNDGLQLNALSHLSVSEVASKTPLNPALRTKNERDTGFCLLLPPPPPTPVLTTVAMS